MEVIHEPLKKTISTVVSLLGEAIENTYGKDFFNTVEDIRKTSTLLREKSPEEKRIILQKIEAKIKSLSIEDQESLALCFALMLEIMNTCENAYRSWRNRDQRISFSNNLPEYIIYVLTAHPTESRHIQNIRLNQKILKILSAGSEDLSSAQIRDLQSLISSALKTPLVRSHAPQVLDEASMIYEILGREEILDTLILESKEVPVYIRSWVGGDKDGHPGVNHKVFLGSLNKSREKILSYLKLKTKDLGIQGLDSFFRSLKTCSPGEDKTIQLFKENILKSFDHKNLRSEGLIKGLFSLFPALVVPLEFREDSEEIKDDPSLLKGMIQALHDLNPKNPTYYVRSLIISMTTSAEDLIRAQKLITDIFLEPLLPVVPLFERNQDLTNSPEIMKDLLQGPYKKTLTFHKNTQEIMLGYSDSSKEGGVFSSRIQIQESMKNLEQVLTDHNIRPIFFHGTGGSLDRGGGPIEDQLSHWSPHALKRPKMTIQGESIDRLFSNDILTRANLRKAKNTAGNVLAAFESVSTNETLLKMKSMAESAYRNLLHQDLFLKTLNVASPYPFLKNLKLGSRPSKRSKGVSVSSIRAIPWILCWTQTRLLLPLWFGVGQAYQSLSSEERLSLKTHINQNPALRSYLRALILTLKKIEVEIWELYINSSSLDSTEKTDIINQITQELSLVKAMTQELSHDSLTPPNWLTESINLRSPLISPLNILQTLAMESKNVKLLRLTVTGIALGMQSTG